MSLVKSSGNKSTEAKFQRIVATTEDIRLEKDSFVFGKPDFVISELKIAIFIDGAFWHGHKDSKLPTTNKVFWEDKILANRRRDRLVNRTLRADSWTVIRFWDYELRKSNWKEVIRRMRRVISIKRATI